MPKLSRASVVGAGTTSATLTPPTTGPYGVPTSSLVKAIVVLVPLAVNVKLSGWYSIFPWLLLPIVYENVVETLPADTSSNLVGGGPSGLPDRKKLTSYSCPAMVEMA